MNRNNQKSLYIPFLAETNSEMATNTMKNDASILTQAHSNVAIMAA
jgi:hypothetical protein